MERVNALINKLQEQSEQHASAADLLNTVQQLQAELVYHITSPAAAPVLPAGASKVAVMMPSANYANGNVGYAREANGTNGGGYSNGNSQNGRYQPMPVQKEIPPQKETPVQIPVQRELPVQKEIPARQEMPVQQEISHNWPLDPLREVPTLAHQEQPAKELNDSIGQLHVSLNDRLRTTQAELADVLTEIPVKDLKKAIGINDRYVFVNELFRGDEAMYERSLKTINAFRILPEAEYWMERELKVKLGWDDGKTTTQHFYQLVKRRFS
jgi:hypothetical protein